MRTDRFTTLDEAAIERQVRDFYARARRDPMLGPVFERAIAPADWPAHLDRMCRFWSSVLLGSRRYAVDPLAAHRRAPGIQPAMFGRWLALWEETASMLFAPELADLLTDRARRIGASLSGALFREPATQPA
jgi:hemoglobin